MFEVDNSCPCCGEYVKGYTLNTGFTVKCVNPSCQHYDHDLYCEMMEAQANAYEDPTMWDLFDNEITKPGVGGNHD